MENLIQKISTFKSGNFVFSLNFDKQKLDSSCIKSKVLLTTIADIPILPNIASQLRRDIIQKSIFSTAAIEGNPLSQEEVKNILTSEDKEKFLKKKEIEILNLEKVYDFIEKFNVPVTQQLSLKEDDIKELHKIITEGCINEKDGMPGNYRNHIVKVGDENHGGIYTPPKCLEDIKNLMTQFMLWINSSAVSVHDIIKPGLAHYYLGLIHPFGDGNGRTARVLEALLLKITGMKFVPPMMSNFYYKNIDEYFWAFSLSEKNSEYDVTPFLEFYLKGLINSLEEARSFIFGKIREFTLRDFYEFLKDDRRITQRQLDLLIFLLKEEKSFKLSDLFSNDKFSIIYRHVSERTARRDLEKLKTEKLLLGEDGGYKLNLNVL